MTIAIIDLGTNTFNLLIAETSKGTFSKIYSTKISVKLGEGGINKNFISDEAFARGINAMVQYNEIIEKHKIKKTVAVATSAVREAKNGKDFIKAVKKQTGIKVKAISGGKEAELIYHGIKKAVILNQKKSLIIDIGGGSVEFIIANKSNIFWKKSYLLGAARLLEKLQPSDPITDKEIEKIENYITKHLSSLFKAVKKHSITELIGSSGSFESLAEMIAHRFYSPEILDGKTEYTFNLNDCDKVYQTILKSTNAQRLKIKGLIKMRVDMIVISSIFVNLIIKKLAIKKMRLSTYSLKEGVIHKHLNSN